MNNTSTNDIAASADQAERIAAAGADIDRLTAQGEREARSMGEIRKELRRRGCQIPLVADIHFNPKAAFAAATEVEKVRINPGNFVTRGGYSNNLNTPTRNMHASYRKSRILSARFGIMPKALHSGSHRGEPRLAIRPDNEPLRRHPRRMVESAMEFLRVAVKHDFHDIVISIKASNTVVMVHTVRLLVDAMDKEDMHFPLHLGVTEAGDGEDGRVRSAAGIGTLLAQGIGDTIRVSLSEDPECEIPVARELADYIASRSNAPSIKGSTAPGYDPVNPQQRTTHRIGNVGGGSLPVVAGYDIIEPGTILADASLPHEQLVDIARTEPRQSDGADFVTPQPCWRTLGSHPCTHCFRDSNPGNRTPHLQRT